MFLENIMCGCAGESLELSVSPFCIELCLTILPVNRIWEFYFFLELLCVKAFLCDPYAEAFCFGFKFCNYDQHPKTNNHHGG